MNPMTRVLVGWVVAMPSAGMVSLLAGVLLFAGTGQWVGAGEARLPELSGLLLQLSDDEYQLREEAETALSEWRPIPLNELLAVANGKDLEGATRAVRVLRRLYSTTVGGDFDAIDDGLQQLVEEGQGLAASRSAFVLEEFRMRRRERAIVSLKDLGAVIRYANRNAFGVIDQDGAERPIQQIMIGRRWTGGDEGLRYLKRIPELNILFYEDAAKVSPQAWIDLVQAIPNLKIDKRGAAFLGLSAQPANDAGVRVEQVTPDGAAAKAGLRPGDTVTKLDGKDVQSFKELLEVLEKHQPGDKIEADVVRFGERFTIEIELGEWTSN